MSAITLLGVSQETYTHGAQVSTESLPPLQTCSYPPPAPATASAPVAAPLVCNDKPVVPGGHPRGLPRVPASFPQSADDQCLQVAASLHPVLSPPPSYLELRFGATTRRLASLTFTTQMVLYMGQCTYNTVTNC